MTGDRTFSAIVLIANAILGAAMFSGPLVWLIVSDKSPLRDHDAAYLRGFVFGMLFVFFLIAGAALFMCARGFWRDDSRRSRPAQ